MGHGPASRNPEATRPIPRFLSQEELLACDLSQLTEALGDTLNTLDIHEGRRVSITLLDEIINRLSSDDYTGRLLLALAKSTDPANTLERLQMALESKFGKKDSPPPVDLFPGITDPEVRGHMMAYHHPDPGRKR